MTRDDRSDHPDDRKNSPTGAFRRIAALNVHDVGLTGGQEHLLLVQREARLAIASLPHETHLLRLLNDGYIIHVMGNHYDHSPGCGLSS